MAAEMAKVGHEIRRAERGGESANVRPLRLSPLNWVMLGTGGGVILLGYLTLAAGSTTVAPILLVLGYCVFIPLGIFL